METLLDRICIRARDNEGKWRSFTLRELSKAGQPSVALAWLMERVCGYEEGAVITEDNLQRLAECLPKGSYVALSPEVPL